MKKKAKSTYRKIENKRSEPLYLIMSGVGVGISAGLVCVLYRFMLSIAEGTLFKVIDIVKGDPLKTTLWLVAVAAMGVIVSLIIKWAPMASGSGIPQVSGEIKGYVSPNWWKVLIAKLTGGSITVLAGLSLGREGPSVQLGGMAAKGVAKMTKADRTTEIRMISCGAGAGLAAAFNAPLAGIMFVLEEIHHTFDKSLLCMGIVSAVVADFVSKIFFGQDTIFHYETSQIPLRQYWILIVLGIVLGLLGAGYNIIMSYGQDLFKKFNKIPQTIRFAIVFFISGIVGLYVPRILGGGHSMVEFLINDHPAISVMIFLLFAKFIFGAFSAGSGAPGGTLYPLLILGTYIGAIFGDISINILGLPADIWQEFVVLSMAGFFASIVRAPITGVVLVFELTGNMDSLLPLVVVCLISYTVADMCGVSPIYSTLLEKFLTNNKDTEIPINTGEKVLQTFVIPTGSPLRNKKIADIEWGKHCLIVSVEREERAITPKGDTVLKEGDELIMMISQRYFAKDKRKIEKIIKGASE